MATESVPVKKTRRASKAKPPKAKPENAVEPGKTHYVKRSLADFPPPPASDDGKHEIGQQVKLLQPLYASGHASEMEFAKAIPGEYGTFKDYGYRPMLGLCYVIKFMDITAFLPDDGEWFEWI